MSAYYDSNRGIQKRFEKKRLAIVQEISPSLTNPTTYLVRGLVRNQPGFDRQKAGRNAKATALGVGPQGNYSNLRFK